MSADLNSWTGIGRLGRDVENPAGNGPARFSIAVNRRAKQGEEWTDEASWIDIEYWHKSILPYLRKGVRIGVRGELRQDKWTDKESGAQRSRLVVVAQDIQLLEPKGESSAPANDGQARTGTARPAAVQTDFPDDIPF